MGCGAAVPTSMSSARVPGVQQQPRRDEVIVDDHVRAAQALETVHGDEARVARAGADQMKPPRVSCIESSLVRSRGPMRVQDVVRTASQETLVRPRVRRASASDRRPAAAARATPAAVRSDDHEPVSVMVSPLTVANAPIGIWQPPPSRDYYRAFGRSASIAVVVADPLERPSAVGAHPRAGSPRR